MPIEKKYKFIIAIAIQTLIVLFLFFGNFITLSQGKSVYLLLQPVDPRDAFRGDYMRLNYRISNAYSYDKILQNGQTVYVAINEENQSASRAYANKPTTGAFIKGVVESGGATDINQQTDDSMPYSHEQNIRVKYNIEEYYIPEGSGISAKFGSEGTNYAEVKVDENGNALIKRLFLDNKPWP